MEIPYEKGLLGHSDADVLLHAVMDAVLGAAALGDIGQHFPDNDPAYKGADSLALTREVARIIAEHGYKVGNIDATILVVAGEVNAGMLSAEKIELRPTARVAATLRARVVSIAEGALFEGEVDNREAPGATPTATSG